MSDLKRLVIVGGGFAGLNLARGLRRERGVEIVLIDRRNHHLFQPLLYQVAMAGLSPAEIAVPIRSLCSHQRNVRVLREEAVHVDFERRILHTTDGEHAFDWLVLACGARHAYFGHEEWEPFAPGLKTLEQATEIRRRVLDAFEEAEKEEDPARQRALLTFAVVGGGPTGVELAGALGEMSRFTLARDFRRIDPKLARVILIEAGPRILPSFSESLASRAVRDLEGLGVQVWTSSPVTGIDSEGVDLRDERITCATVVWAAGVKAAELSARLDVPLDEQGRIPVRPDLSLPRHDDVFVLGDQAHCVDAEGRVLPGLASVALQQGRHLAGELRREIAGLPRRPFHYRNKGQLATIGRSRAILELGRVRLAGMLAWLAWLVVHVYYLVGFKNRLFVVLQWAWAWFAFRRGARLIVGKEWRFYGPGDDLPDR